MTRARTKKRRGTWRRLHPSPIAVAIDGAMFANVGLYDGIVNAEAAVRTAVERGGRVFVGVELREHEVADVKAWLDDASYESLAFVLGARRRSRKPKGSAQ